MAKTIHWQDAIYAYHKARSLRGAARLLDVPYSTFSDYFYRQLDGKVENKLLTRNTEPLSGSTHLYIPDTQCKPGESLEYLRCIGRYIADKQPDVIVHAGDHADMPSLSSYDKGKASAENRRFMDDIQAAIDGIDALLEPIITLQQRQITEWWQSGADGEFELYRPQLVITAGNHENRLERFANENPAFVGTISTSLLKYEDAGFIVVPFLTPITIDGISYIHYVPNPMSGKAMGGSAANILQKVGSSFTMGHRQVLDMATTHNILTGRPKWGLIAGACYPFDEEYKGATGNNHWRGVIMKHNVKDGDYSPCVVNLDWLMEKYGTQG